jgi:hypothetical protein
MTDDLRNRLDHLARRADAISRPDALDRLDRARHRRNRSRKVGALVVAMLIAIGGTATALITFDGDDASRVAGDPSPTADPWTPPDVLTVWPENPVTAHITDPETIQRWVDRGDAELQWRKHPEEVVRRFAAIVLGWSDVTLVEREIEAGADVRVYDVSPCQSDATCYGDPGPAVWLTQPATIGREGIWSVLRVGVPALRIETGTGLIPAGSDLRFRLAATSGTEMHIGIVATNGCASLTDFQPGLSSGPAVLEVPASGAVDGCAEVAVGYAFAYAQAAATVPIGDPFLESAPMEFPWLTVVPVRVDLTGATASSDEDVLSIVCNREGFATVIDQRVVAAGSTGVAIAVRGSDETPQLAFDVQPQGPIGPFFLDEIPSFVDLQPGEHTVSCVHEGDVIGEAESFTVANRSP